MMMMNMGGSGGGSMGSMGGSGSMNSMGSMGGSSSSMGMMDPSMMNMGSMGSDPMAMGQMSMNAYGSMPMQGMAGHGQAVGAHGASGALGFDFVSLLTGLFNFAINIFALLLVVALIVGTFVFIKRYLFEGNINLAGVLAPKVNGSCANCGQTLQAEWNCCPKCGEAKFKPVPQVQIENA